MALLPGRRTAPAATEVPPADPAAAILASLGAVEFVVPRGFWVYVLWQGARPGEPGAEAFYAGHSEPDHLARRLGDHIGKWGARLAGVSVARCADAHDMELTELFLIRKLEAAGHPMINNIGTADYERRRARVREMGQAAPYLASRRPAVPVAEETDPEPAGGAR
jgi:hypothetical protein